MKIILNQTLPKNPAKIFQSLRQEIESMQVQAKEAEVSYRDYKEIDDCDWHDSGSD